jgi:hypothetical protein
MADHGELTGEEGEEEGGEGA